MSDQYYIDLAIDSFGSAVRDNTRQQLIDIGRAVELGEIETEQ
jgi:hypothetical protein